jgi:PAS domain S-box-containing protein
MLVISIPEKCVYRSFLRPRQALLLTLTITSILFGIRILLDPLLENSYPLLVFTIGILISAFYGGVFFGILAMVLSAMLADFYFMVPRLQFELSHHASVVAVYIFLVKGVIISVVVDRLKRTYALAKNSDANRKYNEERLDYALGAGRMVAWDYFIQNQRLWQSTNAESILGVRAFTGDELTAIVFPDDAPRVEKLFLDTISRKGNFVTEFRIKRPDDGRIIWVESRGRCDVDEKGHVVRVSGVLTDINDRVMVATARERARERSDYLARVSDVLARNLGDEQIWNKVAQLALPKLADYCFFDLIHEGGLKRVVAARVDEVDPDNFNWVKEAPLLESDHPIVRALKSKQPVIMNPITDQDCRAIAKNAEHLEIVRQLRARSAVCVPVVLGEEVYGVLTFVYSVSGRSHSEDEVDLAVEFARRTGFAIENRDLVEELRGARDKANAANHAKSQFLANMSHEIRTPMNAILGFSELLTEARFSEDERNQLVARIRANGDQLLHLIDDILDLSKVEAGRVKIERLKFSISTLVREAFDSCALNAQKKGVEARLEFVSSLPEVINSDPIRLRQILDNVLSNAIKFTRDGRIELRVRYMHRPENPMLEIEVTDTGIGIPKDVQNSLFQPFSQADNSITRRFGGTGLGLVLSRRLAAALGGDLRLKWSRQGEGSCFNLRIPTGDISDVRFIESPNKKPMKGTDVSHLQVLVVEDSPDNERLIGIYLKQAGVRYDVAHDGFEAIAKATSKEFDIILMDIQMPGLDGLQATRHLRAQGYQKPILALSAHALPEEAQRSIQAGCDAHLAKPIRANDLIAALAKHGSPNLTSKQRSKGESSEFHDVL